MAGGRLGGWAAGDRHGRDLDHRAFRQAGRWRQLPAHLGFHPLAAWLDRGDGTGEPLAGILRPGNAAANTAADHKDVVDLALAQLPTQARQQQPILVRADSAGATHKFLDHLRALDVRFSVGFDLDSRARTAILALPADAWVAASDADGGDRDGAQVAELATLDLEAAGWPVGTRAICRRERPHPAPS